MLPLICEGKRTRDAWAKFSLHVRKKQASLQHFQFSFFSWTHSLVWYVFIFGNYSQWQSILLLELHFLIVLMLKLNESYKLSQGYRGGVHRSGLVADPTQAGVCEKKTWRQSRWTEHCRKPRHFRFVVALTAVIDFIRQMIASLLKSFFVF